MKNITIYHNPRCSKSRQTLALLEKQGKKFDIVYYLKTPPKAKELERVLEQLAIPARRLLRKNEATYKALHLADPKLTDEHLIKMMCHHPELIERPIVIANNKAKLGRPPEAVLAIL